MKVQIGLMSSMSLCKINFVIGHLCWFDMHGVLENIQPNQYKFIDVFYIHSRQMFDSCQLIMGFDDEKQIKWYFKSMIWNGIIFWSTDSIVKKIYEQLACWESIVVITLFMILLQFCKTACATFLQKNSDVCKLSCMMLQSCNLIYLL